MVFYFVSVSMRGNVKLFQTVLLDSQVGAIVKHYFVGVCEWGVNVSQELMIPPESAHKAMSGSDTMIV